MSLIIHKAFYSHRAPLQELNNVDSPMSTGDAELCPMSVDKSVVVKEPCSLPSIERSVRDRFFEVEEYQKDIYQYLRDAEVIKQCLLSLLNSPWFV